MPISPGSCKFCNSLHLIEFSASERMLGFGDEFTFQQCESCASLQLKDIPQDLTNYYPKEYYSFEPLVRSNSLRILLKKLRMRALFAGVPIPEPPYAYWLKKLHPRFDYKIADVGCGNGQLLYELYAGGFKDLHGFDPFISGDQQIASGLQLWKKEIGQSSETFDLILMHHAFEHMANPREVLKACFERLRPGGKLLIRTPVADAAVFKAEKELWVQLDAPRHLVIGSQKGFRLLAESEGFCLDEIEFDSEAFQFMGTELYKRNLPLTQANLADEFTEGEKEEFQKKALRYNLEGKGDQVCFYLSRRD